MSIGISVVPINTDNFQTVTSICKNYSNLVGMKQSKSCNCPCYFSVVVLIMVITYLIFYFFSLHRITNGVGNSAEFMNSKVAECPGLYSTSLLVLELCGPGPLKKLLAENSNVMIVFYASWCGNCQ